MKLVSKDIMDYLVQAAKDRDHIMEQWKKTIDLNDHMLGTNKELLKHVSDTIDRNKELVEYIKINNTDIIRLCDILQNVINRMNDIDLRLNSLYEVLSNSTKENSDGQSENQLI